ncbi:ArsR/SmtB family transcription factor [Alsobacter sp. R-9]
MPPQLTESQAIGACAALAQETRLRIVRRLVRAGPEGLPAGVLGDAVGASSSRLSFHLAELRDAGLVTSRRQARSIVYAARFDTLGALVRFLAQDCCDGHPEVCAPLAAPSFECCPESADA